MAKRRPIRPVIVVEAIPTEVDRGNTIALSARFFDKITMKEMVVSRIFMTITSMKDGHVVWPLEVVRKDASGFDIMIGTEDMQDDHTYLIRVSNNWNLSPSASTTLHVKKKSILLPIIPFLIIPFGLRIPKDVDRKVDKYIFRTQMDFRVCPLCKEHENEEFLPDDPNIPHIPVHHNCRCTMDVIYVNVQQVTEEMRNAARMAQTIHNLKVPLEAIKVISKSFNYIN